MAVPLPSDGPRMFTLEEANALVPTLQLEFGRLARLRGEVSILVETLGGSEEALALLEEGATPRRGLEAQVERFRDLVGQIHGVVERVNELGCLVKDLEIGLVDFLSTRDDEPVFLCWQFGEPFIAHWHPVDEGFAGRKPLEGLEPKPAGFMN